MIAQLRARSLAVVVERSFVICKTCLECVFSQSYVRLRRFVVLSGDSGLVYDRLFKAVSGQRAVVRFSTVTWLVSIFVCLVYFGLVVAVNGLLDVCHTAVADFKNLVENMAIRKFLVKEF